MRFGVLGSGMVGRTLAAGLAKHGYEVRIASRTPDKLAAFSTDSGIGAVTPSEAASWAEGLVLAVAGRAAADMLRQAGAGNIDGKLVIDVTNPLSQQPPDHGVVRVFMGPNESLMEDLQRTFPAAKFVKAFNSVGAGLMVNPTLPGGPPTMFYCGNDPDAKNIVRRIIEQFGWEPADMGFAAAARAIEPLCQLWCIPGFLENRWTHAFRLLRA